MNAKPRIDHTLQFSSRFDNISWHSFGDSDLGNPSVHEDFASGDEATVVEAMKLTTFCDIEGNAAVLTMVTSS
jgi:hypothetical protein